MAHSCDELVKRYAWNIGMLWLTIVRAILMDGTLGCKTFLPPLNDPYVGTPN